jgi:hypothetical protein
MVWGILLPVFFCSSPGITVPETIISPVNRGQPPMNKSASQKKSPASCDPGFHHGKCANGARPHLHTLITGINQYTNTMEMTHMRSALCLPVVVVLLLSNPLSMTVAARQADGALQAPDSGAWLLLIIIGIIMIGIAAGVLVYSFRLVRAFEENTASLIGALKALTPMPVVTLSGRIPDGMDGCLEVRIAGFSSSPFGQVTVILSPPPSLVLESDHIMLPRLDSGETKVFRIGHGPVRKGKYPVRITILYCSGDRERTMEFTRTVYAGIPAEPETAG